MSRRGWTEKEDQAVRTLVLKLGTKNWSAIAYQLSHTFRFKQRTGKQCRERYHNHLDPKISKRIWSAQQQQILFRMHKTFGNRWTSIAQHLQGRTDNTIKNHFYSTIRRSLRRMSKQIGSKNSTKQMKYIKPSTLSKIFAINLQPTTSQQIQQQRIKCQSNKVYKQLVEYIRFSCNDLTDVILEFSNFKPKGKSNNIHQLDRHRFQQVLDKMVKLNQIYQRMKKQHKKLNATFRLHVQDSSQSSQNSQEEESQQEIKISKVTRSKREIKAPKKFQQNHLKHQKKHRSHILLKKNSSLQRQYQSIPLIKRQSDRVFQNLQMFNNLPDIQIHFKQPNQSQFNPQFQLITTPLAYNPNYFFNTPRIQFQSPVGMSATSLLGDGLIGHLRDSMVIRNGQLEDIASRLTSQIARNSMEDGRTNSSSNINCSPNSAFKSLH